MANILLHPLDLELERRGHRFARYADDLVILVKSQRAGERVMRSIVHYLQSILKLTVNPAKSKVAPMSECSFLGFTIVAKKIRWTDKALADFKHRVRELTSRSWGVSMEHRLHKLGQYVRGWVGCLRARRSAVNAWEPGWTSSRIGKFALRAGRRVGSNTPAPPKTALRSAQGPRPHQLTIELHRIAHPFAVSAFKFNVIFF